MSVLNVNFYSVQEDDIYMLYCTDNEFWVDFQVSIPKRFNEVIDFNELKNGLLTLPSDFSIKVAS